MKRACLLSLVTLLLTLVQVSAFPQVSPVPPLMHYQGHLTNPQGFPAPQGTYSFRFSLWDAPSGGTELWNQTFPAVQVYNGGYEVLFSDLSSGLFRGNLWLEVQVGSEAPLAPRQQVTSVAYAFKADSVADGSITGASIKRGSITADKLSSDLLEPLKQLLGASGLGIASELAAAPGPRPKPILNPQAWLLKGNSGVTSSYFLGTTDNQPMNLRANNRRVMRYQYAENVTDPNNKYRSMNVLGGSEINTIADKVVGATIAGGGRNGFDGTNTPNEIDGDFGFIGGGSGNFLDAFTHGTISGGAGNIGQGKYATIGGGSGNNIQSDYSSIGGGLDNYLFGLYGTIAGGKQNSITASSSTIAGGDHNSITDFASAIGGGQSNTVSSYYATVAGGLQNANSGPYATIGGGAQNVNSAFLATIAGGSQNIATGQYATIGGGSRNTAAADTATIAGGYQNTVNGAFTTIGGGRQNYVWGISDYSVIGGGFSNTVYGDYATIPGGYRNYAYGLASFAAGYRAVANYDGSFVWADAHEADFASTAANQFCIRATGGIVLESFGNVPIYTGVGTGEANHFVQLLNSPNAPSASGLKAGGILCADSFAYANPGKNNMVVKGTLGVGYPDPSPYTFAVNGSTYSLNGYSSSDARFKTHVRTCDTALDAILRLRGVTFEWRREEFQDRNFPTGRQVGFIAQEVETVLPELVSTDSAGYKSVAYANVVPVLVEAVKAQQQQIAALKAELKERDQQQARIERLEQQVAALLAASRQGKKPGE